jgi:fatty acid/phospholipid biosynthesis enzyme
MKFVKWICKGFTANLKIEANEGLMKNLRVLIESSFANHKNALIILVLTLLNYAKLNLKFRSPENVDAFFESLGIKDLSE